MSPPSCVCQPSLCEASSASAPSFTFHAPPILSALNFLHPSVVLPSNNNLHPPAFSSSDKVLSAVSFPFFTPHEMTITLSVVIMIIVLTELFKNNIVLLQFPDLDISKPHFIAMIL